MPDCDTADHVQVPTLVSVVIAALNVRSTIDAQLDALVAQDYAGPFEVVVSDNGSTDGLREPLDGYRTDRFVLQWVDSSATAGVSFARNTGVEAAQVQLFASYGEQGHPRPSALSSLSLVLAVLVLSPLLPESFTRCPRGRWFFHAGTLLGHIGGSIRHRTIYI